MRVMAENTEEDCPCRFYLAEWPEEGEVVMSRVASVGAGQCYVTLPEYGDKEALLPHIELSRRRLRSVHKLVRVGQLLCVLVTRVDEERGYIDVSKRQVDGEESREACRQRFLRGKMVQGVVRRVGDLVGMTSPEELLELNYKTAWRLDSLHNKPTAAYDVFQEAYSNSEALDDLHLDHQPLTYLLEVIKHRFSPRNVTVRAEVEVMCWSSEGVDAVKEALKAGINSPLPSDPPVHVTVVAAPIYTITCVTTSREEANAVLAVQQAMKCIENTICHFSGGKFRVTREPAYSTQLDSDQDDQI